MRSPGKGSVVRSSLAAPPLYRGWRRIMIAFDEATFAAIRARAIDKQRSFATEVRELVAFALEAGK
jgi:hypothetical protein